jgi:hypothetical protein
MIPARDAGTNCAPRALSSISPFMTQPDNVRLLSFLMLGKTGRHDVTSDGKT